jgi:GGDEF domain-containing protein
VVKLRKSLLWVALYLSLIIILGILDEGNRPIINFVSYFYISALTFVLLITVLTSLSKIPLYLLLVASGVIYLALGRLINRSQTGSTALDVIIIELAILELGVWLSFQLGNVITHSESLIDVLAQGSFPNRAIELDEALDKINIEFARSRRYHRQISLMVLQTLPEKSEVVKETLKSLQQDVLNHLHLARTAQMVSECIRQTDMLLQDHSENFIILCPESTLESMVPLAMRIQDKVQQQTGLLVSFGLSLFPDEALTFDDLVQIARERLKAYVQPELPSKKRQLIES